MAYETYTAVAGKARARDLAATESPFTIEVRFLGGLSKRQKTAFKAAADRWAKVIVGDLPQVRIGGEVIDDILIEAQGVGRSTAPARSSARLARRTSAQRRPGPSAFLPAKGIMSFDTADLKQMQTDGTLNDVITHEMGHVIGIGTIWAFKRLLRVRAPTTRRSRGRARWAAYREAAGRAARRPRREHRRAGDGRRALAGDRLQERADVGFIAAPATR